MRTRRDHTHNKHLLT